MKPNEYGARLKQDSNYINTISKKTIYFYDKNIYNLLLDLLYSQIFSIDTSKKKEFSFPYAKQLEECLKSNKRYIVFYLSLFIEDSGNANMIIIDTKNHTIERYEPQGIDPGFYDTKMVDKMMKDYFEPNFSYKGPDDFCLSGLQEVMEENTMYKYNFEGFCKTWSFLYALMRLIVGDEMDLQNFNKNLRDLVLHFAKEYFEIEHGKKITHQNCDFVKMNDRLDTRLVLKGKTIYSER